MAQNQSSDADTHSITRCINQLKQRDPEATEEIWRRFYARLLPLARNKLKGTAGQVVNEDDILVSVFDRFFKAVKEDRFAKLHDRDDLWQILFMLTNNRIVEHYRHISALKRGGGIILRNASGDVSDLAEIADAEPDPEYLVAFNDTLSAAVSGLSDERTREVALLKLEGYTNNEVAQRLDVSLTSVERKLRIIREAWTPLFCPAEETS